MHCSILGILLRNDLVRSPFGIAITCSGFNVPIPPTLLKVLSKSLCSWLFFQSGLCVLKEGNFSGFGKKAFGGHACLCRTVNRQEHRPGNC